MRIEKAPDASRKKRDDMDLNIISARTAKVVGAIIVIALFFAYVLQHSTLTTVSPDSVRFMHFWQRNADQFTSDGGTARSGLKAVFYSLKASNAYDVNRGRLSQYVLFGLDGLTRWLLPSPAINAWMMLLLTLNAALIAWVATGPVRDYCVRLNLFCLGWVVLVTSSLVISPVMLLILYGMYLWVTFILAFFVARSTPVKAAWLAAAAFSAEIGLFAAMLIVALCVVRYVLLHHGGETSGRHSPGYRLARACTLGAIAALIVLFVFYGILAVVFNTGASGLRGLGSHFGVTALRGGEGWWPTLHGVLWRAEELILGMSFGWPPATLIVGLAVLGVIGVGVWTSVRSTMWSGGGRPGRFDDSVGEWLRDERGFFYAFWVAMLVLIAYLFLPPSAGAAGDLTHRSYPNAAVLAVLLVAALVDVCSARVVQAVLVGILAVHFSLLPRAVATTSLCLQGYLFLDESVTKEDINGINRSVMELREKKHSAFFDTFNNGQEIDFSGRFSYSRVNAYGDATGPYFPIQGTVRVLLWPARAGTTSHKRAFDYKSPTFKDLE